MATSAFVPGAGGDSGMEPDGAAPTLAQARQEAAKLRGVLEAINEALVAATLRLETLEAQIASESLEGVEDGDAGGAGHADGDLPRGLSLPPFGPGHGLQRTAGWKMRGWTPPPPASDVVTGEVLRVRREALGISQAAVAHAAHCSRGLVAEVERGKRRSAQTLAHLAKVLDKLEQQARRN